MLFSGHDTAIAVNSWQLWLPALGLHRLGLTIVSHGWQRDTWALPLPTEPLATDRFWEKGIIVLCCECTGELTSSTQ